MRRVSPLALLFWSATLAVSFAATAPDFNELIALKGKALYDAASARDTDRRTISPVHPDAGRDVPFTIVGNQEAPLDLREIRLEAAPN